MNEGFDCRDFAGKVNSVILRMNERGEITFINAFAERFFGYRTEEILGRKLVGTLAPEKETSGRDLTGLIDEICNHPDRYVHHVNENIRRDGSRVWVAWTNSVYTHAESGEKEVLSVGFDFTALKQAETAIREKELLQQTLLANMSAGVIIVDEATRVIESANQAAENMFGAPAEKIVGNKCQQYLCPAQVGHCPVLDMHQELDNSERELLRADGRRLPILKSVKRVKIDNRDKLLEVFVDITERKKAEQLIKDNEERYKAVMAQSYDAVALIDLESLHIVEVNRRFEEITGYELSDTKLLRVYDIFDDATETVDSYLNELRRNGSLPPTIRPGKHKEGKRLLLERTGSLIRIGGRSYQLATFRDVTTEQKRQREIERDLSFAAHVQRTLLPEAPVSDCFQIITLFRPSGFVSGDVYYLKWFESQRVLRGYLVDVTGHGLATALQTAAVNVLLHEVAEMSLSTPLFSQMSWLNRRVAQYFTETAFAAAIGFELNFHKNELRYVGAGITEFLFNDRRVPTPGLFLGVNEKELYTSSVLPFSSGDSICFITDGIADVLTSDAQWGSARANDVCVLFGEDAFADKLSDDATAVFIKIQ